MVRAPPKKSIPLTKVVKPHAKAKVTPSISSTAAAKQPQLKSTNGSSKAKARQDPSKVIAVENTAAKQGMPVDRTPSAGGGPALVARMLGKGPASNSKKTPATSRSKVSIVEPPRRRVYFPGQVCALTTARESYRLCCCMYVLRLLAALRSLLLYGITALPHITNAGKRTQKV